MENQEPESSENADRREERRKPEVSWLADFTKSLRQSIDSSEICTFDRYTKEFVGYLRSEVPSNVSGQLHVRSFFMVKQVQICLCFFSNLYQDASEILDEAVYNVRMMELLPLYLDLELVSFGTRVYKPVEVAERIATNINIFLNKNLLQASEILLHLTTYWISPWFKRIKDLLVCLFKKLLNHQMIPADEVEYVQYILLYRLWMAIVRDCDEIMEIKRHCISHLTLPNNVRITRTMTQIFPRGVPLKSIQTMLIVDFDIFSVTQAFLHHVISLRNNSILGIDLTPDLLAPIENVDEHNAQFDTLETCFDDYVNNIAENFRHNSEMQDSMSDLMNRLLANTSLDASSSRMQMMEKQNKQRHLILSQRRERAEARRRQVQLEQKRMREQAEKQQYALQQHLAAFLCRSQQQAHYSAMGSSKMDEDEVICLDSDDDEDMEKPAVPNIPVNPNRFFDMSENGALRQFVVDIINNTTSTFINETKKQLSLLAFPDQNNQRRLEPKRSRSDDTAVAEKPAEKSKIIDCDEDSMQSVASSSVSVNKPSCSTFPNKTSSASVSLDKTCDSDISSKSDNNISVSVDSSKTNDVPAPSKTVENKCVEISALPSKEKATDETAPAANQQTEEATSTQEVTNSSETPEQESDTTNAPLLTVNTEHEQSSEGNVAADSSQITPVVPDSSKPVITTPELINTCMSMLSKDQTSKNTALVTPSQISRPPSLLMSLASDAGAASEEATEPASSKCMSSLSYESATQKDKERVDENTGGESSITTSLFDERSELDQDANDAVDSSIVSRQDDSLPRIIDCYSLNDLEINSHEETTLQEDVTLNVSPSPKTYIDKGKEGKKTWKDNRSLDDKKNRSLSPSKKVTLTETNSLDYQPQSIVVRRNSFMTPAQLKYMSCEDNLHDSDMELDDCIDQSRDLLVNKESPEDDESKPKGLVNSKSIINAPVGDDPAQSLDYDNILSPVSPTSDPPEVTKSILKRRPIRKDSPNRTDSPSLSAERSILKTSKNKSKSKPTGSHYLVRRSESPSSSQEVKNKHVPVANVIPQYKQVHFPSDVNDNAPTGRSVRVLAGEKKSSDIQFRLNFYKPESAPSTSKNRTSAVACRKDIQHSTPSVNQHHLQSTSSTPPLHQNIRTSTTGMSKLSSANAQRETEPIDKYDPLELFSDTALLHGDEPSQQVQLTHATPDPSLGFTDIYDSSTSPLTNNSQDSGIATMSFDSNVQDSSIVMNELEPPPSNKSLDLSYGNDENAPTAADARPKFFGYKVEPPAFSPASPAQSDMDEQNLECANGEQQTSLPFKKRRKLSVFQASEEIKTEPLVHDQDENVSYPATPMMSIAEVKLLQSLQQLQEGNRRGIFKTPGQLKFVPGPNVQFQNCQYMSNNQGNNTSNFQINSQVPVVNNISFNTNQNINNNFGSDVAGAAGCLNSLHGVGGGGGGVGGGGGALSQFDLNQTMINLSNYHLSQQHLTNFLLNSIHMPQNNGASGTGSADQQQQQQMRQTSRRVQIRKCLDCKRVNCACFAESDSDDGVIEGSAKKSQKRSSSTPTDRVTRSSNRTVTKNYKEPDENKKRRKSGVAKRIKLEN